jgi:uncharacterized protein YkwD
MQVQIEVLTLVAEGRRLGVKSLATGQQNMTLQATAQTHARYQARHKTQGHQHWDDRVRHLRRQMPACSEFREVCNESWPGQSISQAAAEMYRSWKLSPGHWSAVDGRCDFWGYAMVRGSNGIWYATGIFADI